MAEVDKTFKGANFEISIYYKGHLAKVYKIS